MNLKKLAEQNDPKALKVIQHIYGWMVGLDMMENIANDSLELAKLGYEPKHTLKQKNNAFNKAAKEFNKVMRKELGFDQEAEKFGDTADFLQELFDICIFVKPENRIKLLSTAKILTK